MALFRRSGYRAEQQESFSLARMDATTLRSISHTRSVQQLQMTIKLSRDDVSATELTPSTKLPLTISRKCRVIMVKVHANKRIQVRAIYKQIWQLTRIARTRKYGWAHLRKTRNSTFQQQMAQGQTPTTQDVTHALTTKTLSNKRHAPSMNRGVNCAAIQISGDVGHMTHRENTR